MTYDLPLVQFMMHCTHLPQHGARCLTPLKHAPTRAPGAASREPRLGAVRL